MVTKLDHSLAMARKPSNNVIEISQLLEGKLYAFSVFNLPMTKLTQSAPTDWNLPTLDWRLSRTSATYRTTLILKICFRRLSRIVYMINI